MNWIKKIIFYNIILTLPILILIFATEIILSKKIGLGSPVVYEPHVLWGYAPKANNKYKRFDGDTITINNVGLRSITDWEDGKNNILFLGDSITYGGSYINDDQTFTSLICASISDWNCFNGGVNGYGILNMVARSKYDGRIKNAEVIVFTFITEDFDRGLRSSSFAHFIFRKPPKTFPAIWEVLNYISATINPKNWFGKNYIENRAQDEISNEIKANRDFALENLINELKRLKEINKTILLVHSPSIQELEKNDGLNNIYVLNKLKREFPNEYISLSQHFAGLNKEKIEYLYKDSVHYEQKGHEAVAKILTKRLKNILKLN